MSRSRPFPAPLVHVWLGAPPPDPRERRKDQPDVLDTLVPEDAGPDPDAPHADPPRAPADRPRWRW